MYLLDNIYIRFGTKLYRQIVGIPMGTNCAPLVADLFLFCYERDTSVVVPYCYLFLPSVFILWFSCYVSDIFCKF